MAERVEARGIKHLEIKRVQDKVTFVFTDTADKKTAFIIKSIHLHFDYFLRRVGNRQRFGLRIRNHHPIFGLVHEMRFFRAVSY